MATPEANRRKLMGSAMVILQAVNDQDWEDLPLWRKDQLRYTPEVALADYMAELAEAFAALRDKVEGLEEQVEALVSDSADIRKELLAHGRTINDLANKADGTD